MHTLHLVKAEASYNFPKSLINNTNNTVMVLCMNLQQALPTPKVYIDIAFYKRRMWSYNFNIHNYKSDKVHMLMWDEETAKRGAIEICICTNKFINTFVPPLVDKLFIF